MSKKEVKEAIEILGGQRKVAKLLKVTQQYVSNCCIKGYFPPVHAKKVAHHAKVNPIHLVSPTLENFMIDFMFPIDDEPRGNENYQEIDSNHFYHPAFGLV